MTTRDAVRRDREALRARWYEQGFFGSTTVSEALIDGTARHPEVMSVYYRGESARLWSNSELLASGLRLAAALRARGVGRNDVLAVQLPTWVEATLLYHAAAHLGAVMLPVISVYGAAEMRFILRQSQAKFLFVPAVWRGRHYASEYRELLESTSLEGVVEVGESPDGSGLDWHGLLALGEEGFVPEKGDADAVCCLIYTSGTTSDPKGVQHTHNTLLWEWRRPLFADRGTLLCNMPAGHITGYGFLLRPSILGAAQVFMDHWDAGFGARLIERHRIACGGGTPTFLTTLLEAARATGADISSLSVFNLGGQGISPDQVRSAEEHGFSGAKIYGSTEHPTVTTSVPGDSFVNRACTDGLIDTGNEVRVVDDDDEDLPAGSEGNILTRGPDLFVGYLDEVLDDAAFAEGGWFRTGDIGRVGAEGYLTITDRKKDIIIRGGENISSVEVEILLERLPSVRDAAVVAMPDAVYGEKVCAFVVLREGCTLDLGDVRSFFRAQGVAPQKTPERLEIVDELPRNATGKVRKNELKTRLLAATTEETPHAG